MAITETPKVRYIESDSNPNLTGEGAQIPVFIGYSGNTTPIAGIQKFKTYTAAAKTSTPTAGQTGGIGTTTTGNPLLSTIKEFFEEAKKVQEGDITVPYIYVIDLGAKGESVTASTWTNAMSLAKTVREAQVEVYVGFEKADTAQVIVPIMESAYESCKEDSTKGNPRNIYFTVTGTTDEELMAFTDDTSGDGKFILHSRVGLAEPECFGKTIANICCTPYYEEPGYSDFRTIKQGIFNKRTDEEMDDLQAAGIIFIADEMAGSEIHTRINLAVSTAFAENEDARPNDSLFHARRNVDQLVREVYAILFKQLKRNETQINLAYLQTDVNNIIKSKIKDGYMMEGTELTVTEVETNPYSLKVDGVAIPVNSTLSIGFSLFVEQPNAVATGGV